MHFHFWKPNKLYTVHVCAHTHILKEHKYPVLSFFKMGSFLFQTFKVFLPSLSCYSHDPNLQLTVHCLWACNSQLCWFGSMIDYSEWKTTPIKYYTYTKCIGHNCNLYANVTWPPFFLMAYLGGGGNLALHLSKMRFIVINGVIGPHTWKTVSKY